MKKRLPIVEDAIATLPTKFPEFFKSVQIETLGFFRSLPFTSLGWLQFIHRVYSVAFIRKP
ncbi:MAG: hypothetical protein AAGH78_09045 [Cyanobacteria bacterium P01_H01_bin.58]